MIKLKNIIKKLISDPKVQKAVKEKVVPLVKKEIEKRRGNKQSFTLINAIRGIRLFHTIYKKGIQKNNNYLQFKGD